MTLLQHPPPGSAAAIEMPVGVEVLDRNDTPPRRKATAKAHTVVVSLRFYAELLDDIETQRKRQASRLLSLTRDDEWGLGVPEWHPAAVAARSFLDDMVATEKRAVRELAATFKLFPDPVVGFVEETRGLGIKSVSRFLGVVGDPSWHSRMGRPRKLRELYAYCGLDVRDGQAPRNSRGQQSNWNNKARMRVFNMMEPCIKAGGPYRDIYDAAKERYVERGDIESKAHINNRAKRIGMKAIVRDLHTVFTTVRNGVPV